MDITYCADPTCARRGHHIDQWCEDPQKCPGCQPWPAADGIHLCQHHAERLAENIQRIPQLWDDLEEVLGGSGSGDGSPVTGGSVDPAIPINPAVTDLRANIKNGLVSWCRHIAEERGHTLPADTITDICAYLARNASWITAQATIAGEASDTINQLVRITHTHAYPGGHHHISLGPCPHDECDGQIRATIRDETDSRASDVTCTTDGSHTWTTDQWHTLGAQINAPKIVDTATLAAHLKVDVQTIQRLTRNGTLPTVGTGPLATRGKPPRWYDLSAAEKRFHETRGKVAQPTADDV